MVRRGRGGAGRSVRAVSAAQRPRAGLGFVAVERLADTHPLIDDPETGQRFIAYPSGEWGVVDMKRVNDIAEGGMEGLSPSAKLLLSYLTS